jgi:hypothetical protein
MGWLDKVKQAARGRSGMVEKGIDSAVDQVSKVTKGKYDDKLSKGADGLKQQARKLDDARADEGAGPETPPATPPPAATPPTSPPTTPPPAPS